MILGLPDILETTETTEIDISSRSSDADPPLPTILGKENEEIVTFREGKQLCFSISSVSFSFPCKLGS